MHSEISLMLPHQNSINTPVTSTEPGEPFVAAPSVNAGQIVLSESSPVSNTCELSDGSDSEFDYHDASSSLPPLRPVLSWPNAASDAHEGIHYVREKFPHDDIPFLPSPYRKEPLTVEADDKVVILDEVSEHAIRVRLLRTDAVGIIPLWNVEGPLERLARQNMELNEVVTSPRELGETMSHHSRRYSTDEEDLDADFPLTPTSPATFLPARSKSRKVGFSSNEKKTIFRYFPPHDPEEQWDSSDSENGSEDEDRDAPAEVEDSKWWWDGWEESHEHEYESADEQAAASEIDDELAARRHMHLYNSIMLA
ncbi:hypothetical protein BDW22DRAFT_1397879 [Trametopsis cervina]|nr:hypothetical protein BDW22DRAFT_1397879 [Trametopsis cervina]